MIPFVIESGWVGRADKKQCIWAMAKNKNVVSLLDMTDHDMMSRMIRTNPMTIKHILTKSIPDKQHEPMLELLGLHMTQCLWPLCVSILNQRKVSNEVACELLRRAVHIVDVNKILNFLAEDTGYDFSEPEMMHYMAPILCDYLLDFPGNFTLRYRAK